MNKLKTMGTCSTRGIMIGMIVIPLAIMMVVHYQSQNDTMPAPVHDQPAVEAFPCLTNLLLKI